MSRPVVSPLPTVTTTISATTATVPRAVGINSPADQPPTSIEAKLVVLGSQGVGKTSLVNRLVNPNVPLPTSSQATVGASFITKRIHDPDTNTTVRLQIWDTAGQERFRSISRLYYRGANAGLLCYDVTSEKSWEEMKGWLREMRDNVDFADPSNGGAGFVIHVVGTKTDLVAANPDSREVTFERTISYVAEQLGSQVTTLGSANINTDTISSNLSHSSATTPPLSLRPTTSAQIPLHSPDSKRSSGYWNQDLGWDSCHEISAKDDDGVEEVFRVIARKLVEQRHKRDAFEIAQTPAWPETQQSQSGDYFSSSASRTGRGPGSARGSTGSFRVGHGDKRRSWLGLSAIGSTVLDGATDIESEIRFGTKDIDDARRKGRCC